MNYFLKKCQANTLFLIDEFGTGSDPELGGALAEAILEEFYEKQAFGVITTHYTNLKLLADELPCAINANMLFDQKSLQPKFKLDLGRPGSSFTFEVAQKNGIPYRLINKAKKKTQTGKVRFDKTIAKLHKERMVLEKKNELLSKEEIKAKEENLRLESISDKTQSKLEQYQQVIDLNQKALKLGEKVNQLAEAYFYSKNKKLLISELLKIIEIENSKKERESKKEKALKKQKTQKIQKEINQKISIIRQNKLKKTKTSQNDQNKKPTVKLKIGDRVKLIESKSIGVIEKIEKNKAIVNYGVFLSNIDLNKLEYVQPK